MLIILWDVKEPTKSRGRSSWCCGLSSVVYHGWEGKKRGHSNWRKLLWHSARLTGKVNKIKIINIDKKESLVSMTKIFKNTFLILKSVVIPTRSFF